MSKERGDQVLDTLDIDHETLSGKEEAALQALVREYANVFALDSSEMGGTDLVQYVINTGDHPPIISQHGESCSLYMTKLRGL